MGARLDLQAQLEELLGSGNVYFQPPPNVTMSYPAIVYNREWLNKHYADNITYTMKVRWQVTVIDMDPDSVFPDKVAALPLTTFVRHYTSDNLNHDVYNVYF